MRNFLLGAQKKCSIARSNEFARNFFPPPIDLINTGCRVHAISTNGDTAEVLAREVMLRRRTVGVDNSYSDSESSDAANYNKEKELMLKLNKNPMPALCIGNNTVLDFRSFSGIGSRVWGVEEWDGKRFPNQKGDRLLAVDEDPAKGISFAEQALANAGHNVVHLETDVDLSNSEKEHKNSKSEEEDTTRYQSQDRAWGNHAHGLFLRHAIR
eukprot:g20618.t1